MPERIENPVEVTGVVLDVFNVLVPLLAQLLLGKCLWVTKTPTLSLQSVHALRMGDAIHVGQGYSQEKAGENPQGKLFRVNIWERFSRTPQDLRAMEG